MSTGLYHAASSIDDSPRKRRCDGKQPVCSLCEEANESQCVYRELAKARFVVYLCAGGDQQQLIRASEADPTAEILERLQALEDSLHTAPLPSYGFPASADEGYSPAQPSYATAAAPSPLVAATQSTAGPSPHEALQYPPEIPQFAYQMPPIPLQVINPMVIPMSHSTTTGDLLRSPAVTKLLGDYPEDLFLRIETQRAVPNGLKLVSSCLSDAVDNDLSETEAWVDRFYAGPHQWHPVLNESALRSASASGQVTHGQPGAEAMLSIAKALATVSDAESSVHCSGSNAPGLTHASFAIRTSVLRAVESLGNDLELAQTLYLCALYCGYLSRPLQAWRLVHMASTEAQNLWIR